MRPIFPFLFSLSLFGCSSGPEHAPAEKARQEILQAEKDFAALAQREGVQAAFLAFAAEDAVLNRSDQIIHGRAAIRAYYEKSTLSEVSLNWAPDFVDAAASGDLGYTYGKYQFSAMDTTGQPIKAEGIFHTVWKKQTDGSWKFVYD